MGRRKQSTEETTPIPIPPDREALTVENVATILGCGVSSVWRKTKLRQIPAPIRIGGCTRWRRSDIEALLREAA